MRAHEFETEAKLAALRTKQKLEAIFNRLRLERCRKGQPVSPKWETMWKRYIQQQTIATLAAALPAARKYEAK